MGRNDEHACLRRRDLPLLLLILALLLAAAGCAVEELPLEKTTPLTAPSTAAEQLLRSTVQVEARRGNAAMTRISLGTGIILNEDGLIVTNAHVISLAGRTPDVVFVSLPDLRMAQATVIGRLDAVDLAFLDVDAGGLTPAKLAPNLGQVERGEPVLAIGAPHHFEQPVVRGRVSRVARNVRVPSMPGLDALIVTTVRLRQGFSGGPLADARGRVIGVNVAIAVVRGPNGDRSLAIPVEAVFDALSELDIPPPD